MGGRGKVPMLQSQKQALRLRRALLSNMGILISIPLCLMASYVGYFIIEPMKVVLLASLMWFGHIFFVILILTSVNLRFKDASLTLPQMVWVITSLSCLMYFADSIRPFMLMGYLLVMAFGAFRLTHRGFYAVSFYTVSCYLSTLYFIHQHRPDAVHIGQEFFMFVGFSFTLAGFVFMGGEFSNLRKALGDRHRQLKGAVSKIEDLAITDELTGLYNRRYLMNILAQQRALANRSRYGFVVCYIDLDHFKKVNDRYGHPFGDKVLKAFANLISASLREVDIGARLGGEEFVLILADTNLDAAHGVCQRMASKWREHRYSEAPELISTLSAGITEYRSPESIDQVLERADALLYEAKNTGRNKIVVEEQELQVPLDFESDDLSNNRLEVP